MLNLRSRILGNMPSFNIWNSEPQHFISPNARSRYRLNLNATKRGNFVDLMVEQIKDVRIFRIHLLGHFYSQEYVDKWIDIGNQCKYTLFLAYLREEKEKKFDYSTRDDNMTILEVEGSGSSIDCPKIHCGICLKCLSGEPLEVGSYPFL